MTPCLSQLVTLSTPLEAEADALSRAGWTAIELWLTKVEGYLETHAPGELIRLLGDKGLTPAAAAGQGGLLDPGQSGETHWELYRRRLDLLAELGVPRLVLAADVRSAATSELMGPLLANLARAAGEARARGVALALEFQKGSRLVANLETALACVEQVGGDNVGVCLDVFHFWTGSSKLEDLESLDAGRLGWVQLSDLVATPRELAGDGDRIFPGEGEFPIRTIVEILRGMGYAGHVSVELGNPRLWELPADRVVDVAYQAVQRVLAGPPGGPGRREA